MIQRLPQPLFSKAACTFVENDVLLRSQWEGIFARKAPTKKEEVE
jgi:hypothetical protein